MLFIFPIFAFSKCNLTESYSEEFGRILNITDFESCTESDPFDEFQTVTAVSYSKADSTFENSYNLLFYNYNNVKTVMFEGNIKMLHSLTINYFASTLKKVFIYRNLGLIPAYFFDLYTPPILYYYGSEVPTYENEGTFSKFYGKMEIHVSDLYPEDDFLGVNITRDLGQGYIPASTPLPTLATTPLITPSLTPSRTLSTTPLSTPSSTPDLTPLPSTPPESQTPDDSEKSELDIGEPNGPNKTIILITVFAVLIVLAIIAVIIIIIIYRKKHHISEESFSLVDTNPVPVNSPLSTISEQLLK